MSNKNKVPLKQNSRLQWWFLFLIFIYILFYLPVPFFITSPGSAMELNPIIEVDQGYKENGEFMLTTISVRQGSISNFLLAKIHPYLDSIPSRYILQENENAEDYSERQLQIMKISQQDAMINAFKYTNEPIKIKETGVLVMGVLQGYPANQFLEIGDIIVEVDGTKINNVNSLMNSIKNKQPNDIINVKYVRKGKKLTRKIELVEIDQGSSVNMANSVGIGIYPVDAKEVYPSKKVKFHTDDIGGPSAGLMFTLEIINQLTKEDLTKGYKIAGTGEILSNGMVGQIGGANLKVKAAYDNNADIFFVPKDQNKDDRNEKDAMSVNRSLDKPIKVVPIATVDDAVKYLRKLQPKIK